MTPEQIAELMAQIQSVATELRSHVDKSCADVSAKMDGVMDAMKQRKDAADPDTMAEQVAADRAERRADAIQANMRVLQNQVNGLVINGRKTLGSEDEFADAQAKFDSVARALGTRAEPPMQSEDIVAYKIRLARKIQPHSKRFAKAELAKVAADATVFESVIGEIRADALAYSYDPGDRPEFQHHMIEKVLPTGHIQRTFHGRGTIFKQLSRPVRFVKSIGGDDRYSKSVMSSGGGSIRVAH